MIFIILYVLARLFDKLEVEWTKYCLIGAGGRGVPTSHYSNFRIVMAAFSFHDYHHF